MEGRAKTWLAIALCAFVGIVALIDQLSGGKYPVPAFIADLAKIAIPALFVADGLQLAGREIANRRNRDDPPPNPPPAEGEAK